MEKKYIFITGGVVSSLGKGIAGASIGAILQSCGLTVDFLKLDPYLNYDPGTMNPFQHGEVFVTDDGIEADLDLGHYERLLGINMGRKNNATSGQVYSEVIHRERRGDYLGGTIQIIPHITNEIKSRIMDLSEKVDVVISEIGGTVGDIEGLPFLEAIRQMKFDVGDKNILYIHVTLVPYLKAAEELKTKPTQHSVRELRAIGIQPDILICRTEYDLKQAIREKIAGFCNVDLECVLTCKDVDDIYAVPLMLQNQNLGNIVLDKLGILGRDIDLSEWRDLVRKRKSLTRSTTIGLVGKYVDYQDSYRSLEEALIHGGLVNETLVKIKWIDADKLLRKSEELFYKELDGVDGILVPGGFGARGIEGKIQAVKYAREKKIPFFGICLGLQCAAIEYARTKLGWTEANSLEFDSETRHPIFITMKDHAGIRRKGGTMRLGAYQCDIDKDSLAHQIYNSESISERHRHRFEFNPEMEEELSENGLKITGRCPQGQLVEIIEIANHPYFIAVQFHPEFKSTPRKPHPLFTAFLKACLEASAKTDGVVVRELPDDEPASALDSE